MAQVAPPRAVPAFVQDRDRDRRPNGSSNSGDSGARSPTNPEPGAPAGSAMKRPQASATLAAPSSQRRIDEFASNQPSQSASGTTAAAARQHQRWPSVNNHCDVRLDQGAPPDKAWYISAADPNVASSAHAASLKPDDARHMSSALGVPDGPLGPAMDPEPGLDPISQQILRRTQSQPRASLTAHGVVHPKASYAESGPPEILDSDRQGSDPTPLRRVESSSSSKLGKDKKKGVSFLSRIMGSTKKRESVDLRDDTASEISENRSPGVDAEVFSHPVGFIPKFPAPPRYIKVKAQYRKEKDFDRLFLAQILLDHPKAKGRKPSIDAKIHNIGDGPAAAADRSVPPITSAIWAMEFSKDGRYLAAAGQDKKLRVWEVISTLEDREVEERGSETNNAGEDMKLNAPVFKSKLLREYDGHTSSILDLSWSKNNFLLSSSMDKSVRLYHVSRAECLCAFKHNDFVTSIQFHPRDDRFFLAGSLDSKLRLWSIPDKNVAYWTHVQDMVTAVAFTPDGKTAIAGTLNGLCTLYDTEGLKAHSQIHVRSARGKNSKGSKITGIDTILLPREHAQPDVKLLITSNDSRIRVYNLKDRTLEIKFRGNENSCSQIHASFSDDGKYVICGSEDRKVYIWPTAVHERPDNDKRPMEVFEAHTAIVTTALLAPEKTRRLLAQSGDPLYDLCNPPPVTLVSRADSAISSRAQSNQSDEKPGPTEPRLSESPKRVAETPAYQARSSHPGGQIIVSADYTGQIKIFRQDCAYQKRRHESWDTAASFSRKILGRSGSVATRGSATSSTHRSSLVMGSKNPSTDRILHWRNSISISDVGYHSSTSMSELRNPMSNNDRSRSSSPKKSAFHRLSLHRASPPAKTGIMSPTSPEYHSPLSQSLNGPTISVQSPRPESPGSFHSAAQHRALENEKPQAPPSKLRHLPSNPTADDLPHSSNDPLFIMDSQSYLGWDVKHTLLPMARHSPRTPGLLGPDGNPLSRRQSVVSELSSEFTGSERDANSANDSVHDLEEPGPAGRRKPSSRGRRRSSAGSDSDLRCKKCGGRTFKATLTLKGQAFRCKKCGTVV